MIYAIYLVLMLVCLSFHQKNHHTRQRQVGQFQNLNFLYNFPPLLHLKTTLYNGWSCK